MLSDLSLTDAVSLERNHRTLIPRMPMMLISANVATMPRLSASFMVFVMSLADEVRVVSGDSQLPKVYEENGVWQGGPT